MSTPRMNRYLIAVGNDSRKAMTLYRRNLRLSQELFTIISCFEVSLRNAINDLYVKEHGSEWLKKSVSSRGFFSTRKCKGTSKIIRRKLKSLGSDYIHPKLVAEMDFGFWRYLYASPQFSAAGKKLLKMFPAKPKSSPAIQYDNKYVFRQLEKINNLRNRIAHHEAVCFKLGYAEIDTTYASQHYNLTLELFNWMKINEQSLLYGLDHVNTTIAEIENLRS
tara:strand:+ start:5260 stop:5922 length:663 start_codon:yes stop_codon:yes gene_type:complete